RFAAFEALANLPVRKGDYIWASGLLDSESNIRLAAAKAIERTLDDVLSAGIRNMVRNQDQEAVQVVRAVLDSQSKNIVLNLIRHEIGVDLVIDYLTSQAHQDIRAFFFQVLLEAGYADLAQVVIDSQKQQGVKESIKVCAVDDSRMILSVYRSVLNELGYESELFTNPEVALDWLKINQVGFVCTDLNMPEMTGIDLTRALRKIFNKEQLPIIMVTTQNDRQEHGEAIAAGVNCIAAKPFDAKSLQAAIATIHHVSP
ncbi:MAG: response regulator, partial [Desulfobulbaceae bacterium]|nr:response regulator [Desulfobulbaceae bacterium]